MLHEFQFVQQVAAEINSIFGNLFALHEGELLDFDYLMVVKGTRRLKKPNVSSSFVWNGQDVASLTGQGSLYILAKSELLQQDSNERDEESGEVLCSY